MIPPRTTPHRRTAGVSPAKNFGSHTANALAALVERYIFTTDKARVVDSQVNAMALEREAQSHLPKVKAMFGHLGEIRYKKYFGEDGGWRVGFPSFYGFHTRGAGATAAQAIAAMQRLSDDPCPHWDSWVPGAKRSPFTPFPPPVRSCECSAA